MYILYQNTWVTSLCIGIRRQERGCALNSIKFPGQILVLMLQRVRTLPEFIFYWAKHSECFTQWGRREVILRAFFVARLQVLIISDQLAVTCSFAHAIVS